MICCLCFWVKCPLASHVTIEFTNKGLFFIVCFPPVGCYLLVWLDTWLPSFAWFCYLQMNTHTSLCYASFVWIKTASKEANHYVKPSLFTVQLSFGLIERNVHPLCNNSSNTKQRAHCQIFLFSLWFASCFFAYTITEQKRRRKDKFEWRLQWLFMSCLCVFHRK